MIGLGLWLIYTHSFEGNVAHVIDEVYFVPSFFILLGCIVFLISSLGFWGVIRNKTSLLKIVSKISLQKRIFILGVLIFFFLVWLDITRCLIFQNYGRHLCWCALLP